MESTVFFEKKVSITPKELNRVKTEPIDDILLQKAIQMIENKCSEQGFVLPGSVSLLSRSVGYFEAARFTGDSNYYVKLQARVLYPVDGVRLYGEVIRKNKMGLYVNYNNAIHIQVPRDLHIGDEEFDKVEIGQYVLVELKRSKFAINDAFILSSGKYISKNKDQGEEPERDLVEKEQSDRFVESNEVPYTEVEAVEPEVEAVEAEAVEAEVVEAEAKPEVKTKSISLKNALKKKAEAKAAKAAQAAEEARIAQAELNAVDEKEEKPAELAEPVEIDEKEEKLAYTPEIVAPNSPIRAKAAKPAGAPESPKNKTREQQEKDDAALALQLQDGGKVKKRATKTKQKDAV